MVETEPKHRLQFGHSGSSSHRRWSAGALLAADQEEEASPQANSKNEASQNAVDAVV